METEDQLLSITFNNGKLAAVVGSVHFDAKERQITVFGDEGVYSVFNFDSMAYFTVRPVASITDE